MSRMLIAKLYDEETALLEELRGSDLFLRYEAVRRLLEIYDAPRPVGAELDDLMEARPAAPKAPGTLHILERLGSTMRSEVA